VRPNALRFSRRRGAPHQKASKSQRSRAPKAVGCMGVFGGSSLTLTHHAGRNDSCDARQTDADLFLIPLLLSLQMQHLDALRIDHAQKSLAGGLLKHCLRSCLRLCGAFPMQYVNPLLGFIFEQLSIRMASPIIIILPMCKAFLL
jgi:hypothetical protein